MNEEIEYFQIRQAQREDDIATVIKGLTPREQMLVREAAVMGYVRGAMAPRPEVLPSRTADLIPPDLEILKGVIDACLGASDLYPAMKRAYRRGSRK